MRVTKGWFTRATQAYAQARVPFSCVCACVVPVHTWLMLALAWTCKPALRVIHVWLRNFMHSSAHNWYTTFVCWVTVQYSIPSMFGLLCSIVESSMFEKWSFQVTIVLLFRSQTAGPMRTRPMIMHGLKQTRMGRRILRKFRPKWGRYVRRKHDHATPCSRGGWEGGRREGKKVRRKVKVLYLYSVSIISIAGGTELVEWKEREVNRFERKNRLSFLPGWKPSYCYRPRGESNPRPPGSVLQCGFSSTTLDRSAT